MPDPMRIDPQTVNVFLEKRSFSSRQAGDWRIMNKAGVRCTLVIWTHSPLYPDEVPKIRRNAEVPDDEAQRLIDAWGIPDRYPSV